MLKSEKVIRETPKLYEYVLARSNWQKKFFEFNGNTDRFLNDSETRSLLDIVQEKSKELSKTDFRIIKKFDKEKTKEFESLQKK